MENRGQRTIKQENIIFANLCASGTNSILFMLINNMEGFNKMTAFCGLHRHNRMWIIKESSAKLDRYWPIQKPQIHQFEVKHSWFIIKTNT